MAFYQSFAYEASAGSGKTFALVVRYITLLFKGAKPESILALTFTNKAANEMRERIASVLAELEQESRRAELEEIAKALECSGEEILRQKKHVLDRYLKADLKISTIDAFFAQILRSFSLHVGIQPDFLIDQSGNEMRFLKEFLSLVKTEGLYKELVSFSFYEDQRLESIFALLETLYDKDHELRELADREGDLVALERKILSLCEELYDTFAQKEGISPSTLKTLKVDSMEALAKKKWLCKESMEYWHYKKYYTPAADELLMEIKHYLHNYFKLKEGYYRTKYLKLFALYKQTKYRLNRAENLLKFSDISYYTYQLLRGKIENEFLYFRLDAQIDHLLIDEFQDTNILQFRVLEPIIDEIHSGIGTKEFKSFFYVGDTKQSIYRFRGGAKELFGYVAHHYGVQIEKLTTNYRSHSQIVDFVNATFREKIKGYSDQKALSSKQGGYVRVMLDEKVMEMILESVGELLERGVPSDEIAILTFGNDEAQEIATALQEKFDGIEVTTETTRLLLHQPKVRAVVEMMKYLYFGDRLFVKNFQALIGIDPADEIEIGDLKSTIPLLELAKRIILRFELYAEDRELLEFLELLGGYRDIEQFLFESDYIMTPSKTKQNQGIRLMTIHKSKGLEFEHLIVCDRFRKKRSDANPLIFWYDEIELKEFFIRFEGRKCVDPAYNEALEKNQVLSEEDALNLLYVAFTRAKKSLIVCQKEKDSAFELLSLQPGSQGKLEVEHKPKRLSREEVFVYRPFRVGYQEKPKRSSNKNVGDIASIHFGLALHYMLEMLEDFTPQSLEKAFWAMKNRYEMMLHEGESEQIKQRVGRLLSDQRFLELVNGERYMEQPLSFEGEMLVLDLLIKKENRWVVIDYKSSESQRGEHIKQVERYKRALQSLDTQQSIEGYLCYVRAAEIEIIAV